jgi:hypothetical protein
MKRPVWLAMAMPQRPDQARLVFRAELFFNACPEKNTSIEPF